MRTFCTGSRAREARRAGWAPRMQKRRARSALTGRGASTVQFSAEVSQVPDARQGADLPLLGPERATAAADAHQTRAAAVRTPRRRPVPSARCCKSGHPSGALILKPCEFAVKGAPFGRVYDGASATLERRPRQGFRGTYRKDGQVRAWLPVARTCSNRPGPRRPAGNQWTNETPRHGPC